MSTKLADQLAETAGLVDSRLRGGDRTHVPRRVDHVATFRSRAAANRALTELEVAGYEVLSVRRRLARVTVTFARNDAVDHEAAADFTREIVTVVNQQGGTYDGWRAPVVT